MKFKLITNAAMHIDDFCAEHGLEIEVREREPWHIENSLPRYYATFAPSLEIKDRFCSVSPVGDGDYPIIAAQNLVGQISNKPLVLYAASIHRKDIPPTMLTYKEPDPRD